MDFLTMLLVFFVGIVASISAISRLGFISEDSDELISVVRGLKKSLILTLIIGMVLVFVFTVDIFSVYQNGGVLYEEEWNEGTYTVPPLHVLEYDEEGHITGWHEEGEPREVEFKGTGKLMLDEDAEIKNQTIAQIIYRWATDSSRLEAERIKRIGITL